MRSSDEVTKSEHEACGLRQRGPHPNPPPQAGEGIERTHLNLLLQAGEGIKRTQKDSPLPLGRGRERSGG